MNSTQGHAGVGLGARERIATIVEGLVQLTTKARLTLPKSANGQPKPPSDPAAANILRDMNSGRSQEWARIVTVGVCNLTDHVPVDLVTAPARQFIAEMEALAAEQQKMREFVRPLGAVIVLETRAQQRLDLAELRLAESPTSVEALESVLAEADRYAAPFEALRQTCRQTLAVVRSTSREMVGRRRGALKLHA